MGGSITLVFLSCFNVSAILSLSFHAGKSWRTLIFCLHPRFQQCPSVSCSFFSAHLRQVASFLQQGNKIQCVKTPRHRGQSNSGGRYRVRESILSIEPKSRYSRQTPVSEAIDQIDHLFYGEALLRFIRYTIVLGIYLISRRLNPTTLHVALYDIFPSSSFKSLESLFTPD